MLIKKYIKGFLSLAVMLLLAFKSQAIILFVKNGLIICYNSVIPSLYIFMVFSNYVAQSDILPLLSVPFRWYANLLKIKDKQYSAYLLLSLIGGFATGANLLTRLEKSGYDERAINVLSISMINNSFAFCYFAVGAGYLHNQRLGLMLFISLTAASLITAFVTSFIYEYNIVLPTNTYEKTSISFVSAVNSAVQSIITICGFVILFHCICEVVSLYIYNNSIFSLLIYIIMEVTSGCLKIITDCGKNIYLLCTALSIVPISTLCQVYHFTHNKKIIVSLLLSRLLHTPLSLLILSVMLHLFPIAALTDASKVLSVKLWYNSAEISSVMFIITIAFLIISGQNRLFTNPD